MLRACRVEILASRLLPRPTPLSGHAQRAIAHPHMLLLGSAQSRCVRPSPLASPAPAAALTCSHAHRAVNCFSLCPVESATSCPCRPLQRAHRAVDCFSYAFCKRHFLPLPPHPPAAMPTVLSVTLALGAFTLAKEGAIVSRMSGEA